MKRPVRLSDVAKAAGVSLGTASNVFNNKPGQVGPEVRERVQAAARELGYAGLNPKGRLLMGGKVHAMSSTSSPTSPAAPSNATTANSSSPPSPCAPVSSP